MPYLATRILGYRAKKNHPCYGEGCEKPIEPGEQYIIMMMLTKNKKWFAKKYHFDCFTRWLSWRIDAKLDGSYRNLPRKGKLKKLDITNNTLKQRASRMTQVSKAKAELRKLYIRGWDKYQDARKKWQNDTELMNLLSRQWFNLIYNATYIGEHGGYNLSFNGKGEFFTLASIFFNDSSLDNFIKSDGKAVEQEKTDKIVQLLYKRFKKELDEWLPANTTGES